MNPILNEKFTKNEKQSQVKAFETDFFVFQVLKCNVGASKYRLCGCFASRTMNGKIVISFLKWRPISIFYEQFDLRLQ
jgi:hypothetical protein